MMSAFHDIWKSGKDLVPGYSRYEGHEWKQRDIGYGGYWYSESKQTNAITSLLDTQDYHLLILGQFYEAVDLSDLAKRCLSYAQDMDAPFDEPAGHYIIFLFQKMNGRLHVFTNRLGTYHAYYSAQDHILGTYYLGMARQSRNKKLDWEGISGFLSMGYFPADHTYLSSIKILEPASYYRFDSEMKMEQKRRYWNWSYSPVHASTGEWYDRFDAAMRSSLDFALQEKKVAIPISGGLDSRTLAGIIAPSNVEKDTWGFSYGYTRGSVETAIARKIAAARSIRFDAYTVPDYLFDKIDLVSGAVELFQYIDGTRQASVKDELAARSEVVACGHWGDVWLDDMGMEHYSSFEEAFRKKIIKRGSDWLQKNLVVNFLPDADCVLKDHIGKFSADYTYIKDQDFLMKIYKTDHWSFRWTAASLRMYQAASFPVLPFYDKRIVDLFATIPSDVVKGREMQIGYLKKYHPDLARITWQEYGRDLYHYKGFNNRHIIYRAANKLKRTMSGKRTIIRNWELFYLTPQGRQNLEAVLFDESFSVIVSKEKMQSFIDEFYRNPTAANGYTMSMLHTLSRFIRIIS